MNKNRKKSFSFIELIVVVSILSIISYMLIPSKNSLNLITATNRIKIYLKQTRLQAFIDDKYSLTDTLWHKKRWTLKFFRCRSSVGGFYYSIYSDINRTGHPGASESLKDPLTGKNIYSSNSCEQNHANSKYVLLTEQFGITDVEVSCNSTTSLGQISFGSDGKVYSKLSNIDGDYYEYEIDEPCKITLFDKNGDSRSVIIENRTGYIY